MLEPTRYGVVPPCGAQSRRSMAPIADVTLMALRAAAPAHKRSPLTARAGSSCPLINKPQPAWATFDPEGKRVTRSGPSCFLYRMAASDPSETFRASPEPIATGLRPDALR